MSDVLQLPRSEPAELAPPTIPAHWGDALHRIALTVNGTLDIKQTLERLARLTLKAIPADRCDLLLIGESGTTLEPALAIGRTEDPTLWHRFRSMPPIDLLEVPERWKLFAEGRAIAVPDMAASPIVPDHLAEAFQARSALLAPLAAAGEPIGVLILDWKVPGRPVVEEELGLLEAIASYAALAIRNARLYEAQASKARSLQRLMELSRAINATPSSAAVLDLACAGFSELLGANHCVMRLVDDDGQFADPVGDAPTVVSAAELRRVLRRWGAAAAEPVVVRADALDGSDARPGVRSVAMFPLVHRGRVMGAVVVGFPGARRPRSALLDTGRALADLAAAALGRSAADRDLRVRLQQVETLSRLSDVVAGTADLDSALRRLNRGLPELGVSFRAVAVPDRRLREVIGASVPAAEELIAIRSWRAQLGRGRPPGPRPVDGGLLVPVARGKRVLGALRVTAEAAVEEDLLVAIGSGCADVIHNAALHRVLAERERRLTVAAERDRMARDLHDSACQLVTGIGLQLAAHLPEAPDRVWRERIQGLLAQASAASDEIRDAIHARLFLDVGRDGLVPALRALGRGFEKTSGVRAVVRVKGEPAALPPAREDALFRVAHEALANVGRHARASTVSVVLTYALDRVSLAVRDDGVGLGERDPFGASGRHFGLRGLQRLVGDDGGRLVVEAARPRGVRVEATLSRQGGQLDAPLAGRRRR